MFPFQLLKAQEKLPVSFGDNVLESISTLLGLDVNAQFPVCKQFLVGPSSINDLSMMKFLRPTSQIIIH